MTVFLTTELNIMTGNQVLTFQAHRAERQFHGQGPRASALVDVTTSSIQSIL